MKITNGMGINSSNYSQMQTANGVNQDSQLKSIQKQIENVQKQLQSLSSNEKMSVEEKMNKREELQQQLQDLNNQISQRKMEIMQEKREKSAGMVEKPEISQGNTGKQEFDVVGTTALQGIVSTDISMKQVKTVQSVKTGMERRTAVLESEIKMNKGRGGATENKETELTELNERINTSSKDIMDKMSDIDAKIEKSQEEKDKDKTGAIGEDEYLPDSEAGENTSPAKTQESGDTAVGRYVDVTV